ncbi:hypothetical protein ABWK31_20760, partial [Bacillus sp. JJ353]
TKLFTNIEKKVVGKYGEVGKALLKQGIENFGYKDAEDIARKAVIEGDIHTLFDYIPKDHDTENKTLHHLLCLQSYLHKLQSQLSICMATMVKKLSKKEFGNLAKIGVMG